MDLCDYMEDPEKQEAGSPVYIDNNGVSIVFYLKRDGTEQALKEKRDITLKLFSPFHKFTAHDQNVVFAHWLAEYGIVSWEAERKKDKAKVDKFTRASCREMMLDPRYIGSLVDIFYRFCNSYENYLYDQTEEATESLKKP